MTIVAQRNPVTNPRVHDIVQGVWKNPALHRSKPSILTCQAVVGNLVAYTTNQMNDREIHWVELENWCASDSWIDRYEVLHRGDVK